MTTVLATAPAATSISPAPVIRRTPPSQVVSKIRVKIHVDAEVLDPEVTRRKANVWLLMNAGNLLGAENPELILEDRLLWRMDVVLTWPTRGYIGKVGKICMDAITGEAVVSESLPAELEANATALVAH